MPDFENVTIVGAGMAGLSAAWWAVRQQPGLPVVVLERESGPLAWLADESPEPVVLGRGSGGIPPVKEDYPGGWPEIGRILQKWEGSATRGWLESLGVELVRLDEEAFGCSGGGDLREALIRSLTDLGVRLRTSFAVETVSAQPGGGFRVWSRDGQVEAGGALLLATGGERNHGLKLASEFGFTVNAPVPAFLRLRLASPKLGHQLGPMTRDIGLSCLKSGEQSRGKATLSGRGLEGPAVSDLSSRLHRLWKQLNYRLQLAVDWFPDLRGASIRQELASRCERGGRRLVGEEPLLGFSQRQWVYFLESVRIDPDLPWGRIKAKKVQALTQRLKNDPVAVAGMGLPAGERAWAGGIDLSTLDLNRCQSLRHPGLFAAGEMLDFSGRPGGHHLNAVWASGYLAGSSMGLGLAGEAS